jgi:hypothetical protein
MTQEGMVERRIRSHMAAEKSAMRVPANLETTILRAIDNTSAAVSRQPSWRRIALRSALVALALSLLAATPLRTFAGETLQRLPFGAVQRFGTVLIDPGQLFRKETAPPPNNLRAPVASSPRLMTPSLSLAEAQRLVDFAIRTPSWLPPGVVFRGALVGPDGSVVVSYRAANDPSKGLFIQMQRGAQVGGYVLPSSAAQDVRVNGHTAVYAQGSWDEFQRWNGRADAALLSWDENAFTYVLSFSGLGLSRDDVIRIAESLR